MADYKSALEEILREAGDLIIRYRKNFDVSQEKEKHEIVTPADVASNQFIIKKLQQLYPDIEIYSEEELGNKSQKETRWIVDPLDGTTPWVWGNSGFSISIALEIDGRIEVGAVYDPVMKEFFYAQKGQGASRNNQIIQTSQAIALKDMLIVVDWGNKDEKRIEGLNYFRKFIDPQLIARRVVPQFAPASGLCHIAEGRIHALICNDTWVEDHSAGSLILREAGGYCTNFYNLQSFNHRESGIIAVNSQLIHSELVKIIK